MYRFLSILPFSILILASCWGLVYKNYVKVDSRVEKAFHAKSSDILRSIVIDHQFNWFQRTSAMERYAQLACSRSDSFLRQVLEGTDISLRRGALAGCLTQSIEKIGWVIPLGLQDSYSFNRYQTLRYLRSGEQHSRFQALVEPLTRDSSSMVSNEARELLGMIDKVPLEIAQ